MSKEKIDISALTEEELVRLYNREYMRKYRHPEYEPIIPINYGSKPRMIDGNISTVLKSSTTKKDNGLRIIRPEHFPIDGSKFGTGYYQSLSIGIQLIQALMVESICHPTVVYAGWFIKGGYQIKALGTLENLPYPDFEEPYYNDNYAPVKAMIVLDGCIQIDYGLMLAD